MFYHEQNICSGPFSKCCSKNTTSRLSAQLRLHRIIPKILTESKHISPVVAWVMERNLAIIHLGFLYLLAQQLSIVEREEQQKLGKVFHPQQQSFPLSTTCQNGKRSLRCLWRRRVDKAATQSLGRPRQPPATAAAPGIKVWKLLDEKEATTQQSTATTNATASPPTATTTTSTTAKNLRFQPPLRMLLLLLLVALPPSTYDIPHQFFYLPESTWLMCVATTRTTTT